MNEEKICPKCGCVITGHPSISREDNKTEICSNCGAREALEDFNKAMYQTISPVIKSIADTINDVAKGFVDIWDKIKPKLNFLDKKISKRRFKKLLQSYGIQRNEINKIMADIKEPYTIKLLMKYAPKGSVIK